MNLVVDWWIHFYLIFSLNENVLNHCDITIDSFKMKRKFFHFLLLLSILCVLSRYYLRDGCHLTRKKTQNFTYEILGALTHKLARTAHNISDKFILNANIPIQSKLSINMKFPKKKMCFRFRVSSRSLIPIPNTRSGFSSSKILTFLFYIIF